MSDPAADETASVADRDEVRRAIEAILTVADTPVSVSALARTLDAPPGIVRECVEALRADYDGAEGTRRGFELRHLGGGWRLYVRADYDEVVAGFVAGRGGSRLSQAALETLAVIAYKQPVTRAQVSAIRAVNADSVVRTLLSHGLITELFADDETGAINYGTTDLLLTQLGISSIDELPKISPLLDDGAEGFDDDA
jgi:segregation and condensation protein B